MGESVSRSMARLAGIASTRMGNKKLTRPLLCREAWRYSGIFTRWNRFKGSLPGLGIASVAFAAYCGYEYFFLKDEHHGAGHEEAHH